MKIIFWDGLTATKNCNSIEEAKEIILEYYPNAFFGSEEENYEGDKVWISVWQDEESSIDDSGEGAIAQIVIREVA